MGGFSIIILLVGIVGLLVLAGIFRLLLRKRDPWA